KAACWRWGGATPPWPSTRNRTARAGTPTSSGWSTTRRASRGSARGERLGRPDRGRRPGHGRPWVARVSWAVDDAERRPELEDELWAAVGEPSRRRVLDVLLDRGEATPTVLSRALPLTRQAIAKHLAVLERAGLVEARRQGREVRYSVDADRVAAAADAMARAAARWDRRLAAIKGIAEAIHREQAGA